MAITALGVAVGGSITTALGTMLFLKAETEAQKSGGFVKFIIRFLIIAIIIRHPCFRQARYFQMTEIRVMWFQIIYRETSVNINSIFEKNAS